MNEAKHLPSGNSAQGPLKPGNRLRPIDHVGLEGDEVGGRITGHLSWPLHLADLPCLGGGSETVILANANAGPRAPENSSAPLVRSRVVETSISTRLASGTEALTGNNTPGGVVAHAANGEDHRKDQGQIENAVADRFCNSRP